MRPLTFINGVVFGSAAALGLVLLLVIFFRWVMTLDSTLDQTVVSSDLPLDQLRVYVGVFLGFAALAGVNFWTELRQRPTRWLWQYLTTVALLAVIIFFLAEREARGRELVMLALVAVAAGAALLGAWRLGLLRWMRRRLEH